MKVKNLLSIADLTPKEIESLVERAIELKAGIASKALAGRSVVLLFEKPSLRTRASFDVGIHQLGGYCLYMGGQEVGFGVREPVADVAKVLSRYVDCIVARVNDHASLEELAQYASVPVINALSDWEHPCQALADLQTIREAKGTLKGLTIAFLGDGNNVARSLALGVSSVGGNFTIASPKGYELDSATLEQARQRAAEWEGVVRTTDDVREAVSGADAVYTDVWVSMGDETDRSARLKAFQGYTVDPELMSLAKADAIFMHDMPAHYGEEVAPGMLDHPQSVAFDQAENRLHAQKAVLEYLLKPK
ncbi:MAG: ornithine carbamoyltransferase [Chloroflexi bacterium]|nr:ornithine carbamoyltransferase [Chloroflexota bacterium]